MVAGALAVALAVALAGWWRATRPAPLRPLVRLNAEISPDTPLATGVNGSLMALSPDGTRLALLLRGVDGKVRLHTRLMHQSAVTPLAGTEDAATPFFSPEGAWIGFTADGKLKKIPEAGGVAITLCDVPGLRGASWGDDGNIVLASAAASVLSRVPSAGGTPVPLTKMNPGETTHRWPQVLAGSQNVLFTAGLGGRPNFDSASIDVISLKTGERKTVQRGGFSGRYLATSNSTGYLVYMQKNTLFAAPFDPERLITTGAAVPLLEDVSGTGARGGDFTFSATGAFVYVAGVGQEVSISWLDSSGQAQPLHAASGRYSAPRLSPDGKRLAFSIDNGQGSDIWVKDLDRDTPSRLTFLNGENTLPVWAPDGRNIVFRSEDPASRGMYWIRSDSSGSPQRLTDGRLFAEMPSSFSPDGKRLAFTHGGRDYDIFTASVEGDPGHPKLGKPELFLGTPFAEYDPAFSPDGRWLAYVSNESKVSEVYVRPFPGPGGRWRNFDRWRPSPTLVEHRPRIVFSSYVGRPCYGRQLQCHRGLFHRGQAPGVVRVPSSDVFRLFTLRPFAEWQANSGDIGYRGRAKAHHASDIPAELLR